MLSRNVQKYIKDHSFCSDLKEPIKTNKKDYIYKIMLYQTKKDGVYLFMYCQKEAVQCSFDYWYKTVEDVYEDWNDLVNEKGWILIDDPLPYCQHDAFLPIRVKGRDIGEPDRKSTRLNSSHRSLSRMPSSA